MEPIEDILIISVSVQIMNCITPEFVVECRVSQVGTMNKSARFSECQVSQ